MAVRKPTLLCIDDDAQCLAVRRLLFEAFGFAVVSSTSPRQGLRLYQLKRYDAAVIDYQMPEMNGGELAREMKKVRADVPVIILSGLIDIPKEVPECYDRFVSKSDSGFKLVKEIQSLIGGSPGNGGPPESLPVRQRIFAIAGIAAGFAAEGITEVWSRARRRPSHALGMKRVVAARA